jgi:hypothetical protein
MAAPAASAAVQPGSFPRNVSAQRAEAADREAWWLSLPRIVVLVTKVHEDCEVQFEVLLDRNGMPVDRDVAPLHTIPAAMLLGDLDARVLSQDDLTLVKEHATNTCAALPRATARAVPGS